MINQLRLRVRIALYTLNELFKEDPVIIAGSVADYFNVCDKIEYFFPKDVDVMMTTQQLEKLQDHFFVREVEGMYNQGKRKEYYCILSGCGIDITVYDDVDIKDINQYKSGLWDLKYVNTQARVIEHKRAIDNKQISKGRKQKHFNRLTFYRLRGCI